MILVIGEDNKQAVLAQKYEGEEPGNIKLSHLTSDFIIPYEFHDKTSLSSLQPPPILPLFLCNEQDSHIIWIIAYFVRTVKLQTWVGLQKVFQSSE